jgi:signal peptidase II
MTETSPIDPTIENEFPSKSSTELLADYGFLLSFSGALILLDQLTKTWVRDNLPYGEQWMPWDWLAPYARILHWRNTGAAFGMFQGGATFFLILGFIVTGLIIYYFPQVPRTDKLFRFALSFQLAGAVGNLIDRVRLGHVTDFISVGNFAVFNVADSAISVGTALLLLGVYLAERKEKALAAQTGSQVTEVADQGE